MASSQRPSNIRKVLIFEAWIDRLALSSLLVIADRRREAKTDVDRQVEDRHQGGATSSRPALI